MSVKIAASGAAAEAIDRVVPQLVIDLVASGITAQDGSLWGAAAEEESTKRLGWVEAVAISEPIVADIVALRERLNSLGVDRIVLSGMGGSSLAPEVICATSGVPLVVLDTTDPAQVLAAISHDIDRTAVVVSSKSGSTVETDSHKRAFEAAFTAAGIDPVDRVIVVTDPGSPLDVASRDAGYRVFNADPNVGGRFSALTAFGLVPSGLAGADIEELLVEAEATLLDLAIDSPSNPGLVLGAAIAGTRPLKDKLAIVTDGTHIVGFGDWAEQLVAESTGKNGKGLLPVVLSPDAHELRDVADDVQVVRLVGDYEATTHVADGEVEITGTLGAMLLTWEYAIAVAGRLLGINPFDQPDVESAKIAARALIDNPQSRPAAAFVDGAIEVRGSVELLGDATTVTAALGNLVAAVPESGYLSVQAYLDRLGLAELAEIREPLAELTGRPVTFGWGPRFLHSTGQYHKGGPEIGAFLQITGESAVDLDIPDRPFTFGQLILAQADGDAAVLAGKGLPVLGLTLTDIPAGVAQLREVLAALS